MVQLEPRQRPQMCFVAYLTGRDRHRVDSPSRRDQAISESRSFGVSLFALRCDDDSCFNIIVDDIPRSLSTNNKGVSAYGYAICQFPAGREQFSMFRAKSRAERVSLAECPSLGDCRPLEIDMRNASRRDFLIPRHDNRCGEQKSEPKRPDRIVKCN